MPRYLLLITTDQTVPPSEADQREAPDVMAWWRLLHAAGRHTLGDALVPASQAATVRVRGRKVDRTDGPFCEASTAIAGFDVIEASSLDDAVSIASGHPMAWTHAVEVRELAALTG